MQSSSYGLLLIIVQLHLTQEIFHETTQKTIDPKGPKLKLINLFNFEKSFFFQIQKKKQQTNKQINQKTKDTIQPH